MPVERSVDYRTEIEIYHPNKHPRNDRKFDEMLMGIGKWYPKLQLAEVVDHRIVNDDVDVLEQEANRAPTPTSDAASSKEPWSSFNLRRF